MQNMGLEAIYPKPNLSKRFHSKYVRPYLLRGLSIDRPNHVWGLTSPIYGWAKASCTYSTSSTGTAAK
ncbi:hypothetical protein ACT8ZS_04980 [Paenibacillus sp. M.A.Huq-84]